VILALLRELSSKRALVIIKMAVSLGLIAWLVAGTEREELMDALGRASLAVVIAAVLVLLVLAVVQTARWIIVARSLDLVFPWMSAFVIVLIGTFFNQVLPSSVGGDAARVWRLRSAGVPVAKSVNTVVIDRLVALLGVVVISGVATPLLFQWIEQPGKRIVLVLAELGILAALAVALNLDRIRLPRRLSLGRGTRAAFSGDARRLFSSPRALAPALGLSLVIHCGVSFVVWMLARSVGADIALYECVVLVPAVMLLAMLPVSVAGWGVREGAMVVAMGLLGVSRTDALATSVLFGLATAGSGLPGLVLWLTTSRQPGSAAQRLGAIDERAA
jgi:uncharacterized membrane protein YbhN (UPF0104 family)